MDLGLTEKRAVVAASSAGLGLACAAELAREGAEVVLNGRDERRLEAAAERLRDETGGSVRHVAADLGTGAGRAALLAACPDPDILVTNNGGPPPRDFRDLDDAAIRAGLEANMVAPLALIRAVLPGMADRGFGRIVNITSVSVLLPLAGLDLSSGARAGLTAFLAGVARQYAGRNVTVNNLLPGKIATGRLEAVVAAQAGDGDAAAERARQEAAIPAGRFGTPAEFAHACAMLCAARAGYLTGQNILVDGGLYPSAF
ncbi:SDR family oxidoreductase [Rhodobacterales bacterium HKCCE2091]|nr:SDR family oxidoreductase [Rhodobacterales bacterium HKCCE2091]